MSDILYQIAATRIPKAGPVLTRQLIAWCGGPRQIFEASPRELLKIPGIGRKMVQHISDKQILLTAERELEFIHSNNIKVCFYLDADFPQRLIHYHDAPLLLYYQGNMNLNHTRTVGIVGTRKPTEPGKIICNEIIEGLLDYDVAIISGLAYGIDIHAHKKALELGIPTLACLGHGLHMVYPAAHRKQAKEMKTGKGGLITEFTSEEKPDGPHFPMRNRIIAGMSDALVVVETANKGGSMITAEIANQYNKDVFAVPGRVRDAYSQGCNALIKKHKAHLLESASDLVYIMGWDKEEKTKVIQQQLFVDLNENEQVIVDVLQGKENESIDELSHTTQFKHSQLAMILLEMEFKGIIRSLPGKRYMLV